jgi:hypothetical protein
MAHNAIPAPPMPKAPQYMRPPLSWLVADVNLLPYQAREMFDRGETVLHHKTWSVLFHPDKVKVRASDSIYDIKKQKVILSRLRQPMIYVFASTIVLLRCTSFNILSPLVYIFVHSDLCR